MKIIEFHAENIKRIKAIDITPQGNVVVISGMNENGKTSVLDAIWLALQYKSAARDNPTPLRTGTDKGVVRLDLGDYIVTRTFSEGRTQLQITTPDGNKVSSPQKLLDGLIGDLAFDPWAFSRMSEKDQKEMLGELLYKLTNGKVDLSEFERRRQELYDERTDKNREQKRLTTVLSTLKPPTESDPQEEVSVSDLTKSISDAADVEIQRKELVSGHAKLVALIADLEKQLETAKVALDSTESKLNAMPEPVDVEFLQGQLKEIDTLNKRAREVNQYITTKKTLSSVNESIKTINNKMELLDIEKAEALENSPLPVKGFSVTPDGVMITNEEGDLVPFRQASAARRLRISLGIAMANNPKLRVIRVADGSLLDDDSMQIIQEMTKAKDYQMWIEYASRNDQDRIGVYIEDGQAN
jgi:DNA repair exonuclease SbcCD ATPase subunit